MSARKVAIKKSMYSGLAVALVAALAIPELAWTQANRKKSAKSAKPAPAKNRATVGDLLKNIERKAKEVQINKSRSALPQFQKQQFKIQPKNLTAVKPPANSNFFYEEGTNEAALDQVTDEQINHLFNLTKRFGKSSKRGELWLRLAELYVEKARLIEYRLQNEYDAKLMEFHKGTTKKKPALDLKPAQAYNQKAIQLYEWFLRDFPKDPKNDQALFFLGYNYFEIGEVKKGTEYYLRLTKEYPKSAYIEESNFALGEYYFENEKWADALTHYARVARNRRARLFSFALYKTAWCQYKTGKVQEALKSLERVIIVGRRSKGSQDKSAGGVSRIRLASEALKDLVIFFAEAGKHEEAREYFAKVAGPKSVDRLLEKLAYYYVDTGNRTGARYIFGDLIDKEPMAPKAYDYQYQIVTMFAAGGEDKVFRAELYRWIEQYGPESVWAKSNQGNGELLVKSEQLIETTLRNYVLQQHQTAQNSKAAYSQKNAQSGYDLYFSAFKNSPKIDEMHFFYGELLFDMKDFERAAYHYLWIAENAKQSPYYEKAMLNAILALEKKLPTTAEIKKMVGNSIEPMEFDRNVKAFESTALKYFAAFPKGENRVAIEYRLGSLHYYYNHFDQALEIFNQIIKGYPKSKEAEYSANLILDIYNLKKDYVGLEKAASSILSVPGFSSSPVAAQISGIKQRSAFKQAEELEKTKDYTKSAMAYEEFAAKNPGGDLAVTARFNAAVNYERANDLGKAIVMYAAILGTRGNQHEDMRKKSRRFLAALYERTGQYEKAADAFEKYAEENPKDPISTDFYYNAAVIQHGMKHYNSALKNYEKYYAKSKKRDKTQVLFLIATMWEARNNSSRAIAYYEQYLKDNPTNARGVIEAHFTIAKLNERLGRRTKADEWYEKTIAVQRRLSKQGQTIGVPQAAEAKFKQVYKIYEELRAIRIPANPQNQAKAVQQKLNLLNRLKEQLKTVIAYDDGHQIVAALSLQGQALQHMAAAIYGAPKPKGLKPEELKLYQDGIDKLARPFQDQAVEAYKAAIAKGNSLQGYNDWLKAAVTELGKLNKDAAADRGEEVTLTQLTDKMGL